MHITAQALVSVINSKVITRIDTLRKQFNAEWPADECRDWEQTERAYEFDYVMIELALTRRIQMYPHDHVSAMKEEEFRQLIRHEMDDGREVYFNCAVPA